MKAVGGRGVTGYSYIRGPIFFWTGAPLRVNPALFSYWRWKLCTACKTLVRQTHTHTRMHARTHTHIHTHTFNGPLSGTTRVSRYQKGTINLDFTEARDSEWQWHQLDHMQVCNSLQTDNHTSTSLLSFYRPDALPAAQPTASKH